MEWVERLAKWRSFFAGWLLGTRPVTDGPTRMVRDLVERTLILRAEVSALTALLIEAGVTDQEKLREQIEEEARHLCVALSERFPGVVATDDGLQMDRRAVETFAREGFAE